MDRHAASDAFEGNWRDQRKARQRSVFEEGSMDYLLDTNACVAILRNKPPCVRNHADRARADGSRLAISSIALHELWYGTFKSSRVDEGAWHLRMFLAGGIKVLAL